MAQGIGAAEVPPAPTQQLSIACTVGGCRGTFALHHSKGRALLVSDADALAAQSRLARQGLWQELSGATGLAAIGQLTAEETEGGPVVIIGTSGGFKDPLDPVPLKEIAPDFASVGAWLHQRHGIRLDGA